MYENPGQANPFCGKRQRELTVLFLSAHHHVGPGISMVPRESLLVMPLSTGGVITLTFTCRKRRQKGQIFHIHTTMSLHIHTNPCFIGFYSLCNLHFEIIFSALYDSLCVGTVLTETKQN